MKKLLLLLLVMIPTLCISQTIKERKTDKFNGIKTISTSEERLVVAMGYPQVSIQGGLMSDKNNESLIALYFSFRASGVMSLTTDKSSVTLLLDNSESMELKYVGKYKIYSSGDFIILYVNPSEEELKLLSEHKVTDIRIYTSERVDYKIKEKLQPVIGNIAKLLLSELSDLSKNEVANTSEIKGSVADELKKLKELLDSGAITQEEYDAQKKKLLN